MVYCTLLVTGLALIFVDVGALEETTSGDSIPNSHFRNSSGGFELNANILPIAVEAMEPQLDHFFKAMNVQQLDSENVPTYRLQFWKKRETCARKCIWLQATRVGADSCAVPYPAK